MSGVKVAIIGAGSSYSPELIEGFAKLKDRLPIREIVLMDIDEQRLDIMLGFSKRFAQYLNFPVNIRATTDRRDAIEGAAFVNVQIRVGGNAARINDEKIPNRYGLIGQETTGAGGFTKALRTIPAMLEIARDVERYSPDAWIINYTNPAGLVTEAVTKYSKANMAGLCSGGLFPRNWTAKALGVDPDSVRYDFYGLNHLNYAWNITVDGRSLTDEEFDLAADRTWSLDKEMVKRLRLLPSPYLQYFYHKGLRVAEQLEAPLTRGEQVQLLEKEVFAAYADPEQYEKPAALAKRGGGGYSEVALGIMDAIYNDRNMWAVVNVPNRGAVPMMPDDAVVEIACNVNKNGIKPLPLRDIPTIGWGLVSAVKNYEQLTVEAAVHGDKEKALLALLAHPLVGEYDIAVPLLDDLLEANKVYLPQFFGNR
ncbi:6-phospho-beta-glucosidase [Cohnella pontilimi]|uniref:6-phospho-beta-glucosidase n=1 Tax=Cohnella pontilimi TaxID=2564100 RepID=A0A4U0FF22_9BACL|nr:6-phospho-beta-glucosidase [Cohnella pontilimi]TJY43556.1 6-phospho-beta-glucosidase [Cohnella pontilimi]